MSAKTSKTSKGGNNNNSNNNNKNKGANGKADAREVLDICMPCDYGPKCNKKPTCRYTHVKEVKDTVETAIRSNKVCKRFLRNKWCDFRCWYNHIRYPVTSELLRLASDSVTAGLVNGNYIATLTSPDDLQCFKFNFTQVDGETFVGQREKSSVVMRYQIKPFIHPDNIYDYVPAEVVEKVLKTPKGKSQWADVHEIPAADDSIDRDMWKMRVDLGSRKQREVRVEFICELQPGNPRPTAMAAIGDANTNEDDESAAPPNCMRLIMEFHIKSPKEESRMNRTSGVGLDEWLCVYRLPTAYPHYQSWQTLLQPSLTDCLNEWTDFLQCTDWKFKFSGYAEEAKESDLVLLSEVAANLGNPVVVEEAVEDTTETPAAAAADADASEGEGGESGESGESATTPAADGESAEAEEAAAEETPADEEAAEEETKAEGDDAAESADK